MIQTVAPFHQCVECDEIITNPICGDCLAKEMKVMIAEYDSMLAETITGISIEGNTTCILCMKRMGLCPHCFSKGIYEYLQEQNKIVAKEFLNRFDFELRRELTDFS